MYKIKKKFHFSAAHHLTDLPPTHQCSRHHGHNYIVEVELVSDDLNKQGFIVDYGDLQPLKDYIDNNLDHRDLNEVLDFQTSAENLAKYLYDFCKKLWKQTHSVAVSETSKTWATYGEIKNDI